MTNRESAIEIADGNIVLDTPDLMVYAFDWVLADIDKDLYDIIEKAKEFTISA